MRYFHCCRDDWRVGAGEGNELSYSAWEVLVLPFNYAVRHSIATVAPIHFQRIAMNAKPWVLVFIIFVGSWNTSMADSCRANIFDGQDCRYDDGTTSSSRANIFGGQDITYSDGRKATSRANIFGGQDTNYSDGKKSSSRANTFGGQDTHYNDGSQSSSRANIFNGQDTHYSNGKSSTSRANIFGGQDTKNY